MAPRSFGTVRPTGEGKWSARYQVAGRKYSSPEPFVKESQARAWLEKERALIRDGDWTDPAERYAAKQRSKLTVGQWLDRYHDIKEAEGLRKSTLRTYRNHTASRIHAYPIAKIPLVDLTAEDVQDWWDGLQREFPERDDRKASGRETSRKAYVRLKAACGEAVARKMIPANPVEVRKAGKKITTKTKELPTRDELRAIVDHVPDAYRFVAVMCAFHGLRIGEALGLEPDDVLVSELTDDDRPTVDGKLFIGPLLPSVKIRVKGNVQRIVEDGHTMMVRQGTKTVSGEREVPVLDGFEGIVFNQKATASAAGDEYLTTTRNGAVVMDTSFRSIWNRAREKAGVRADITPHYGRNWLTVELAESGATPAEIGSILGQKDLTTIVSVYMKVKANRPTDLMKKVSGR
ncbi:tyrosine-type recombinase/integrase [Corynebacterium glyciniphilum]|uniref:tyrosine-type recombinase/integrase n=1 Tax=Corynebacterium glyciniphilum TaxID=1404244 RepID=UPI0011AB3461|nr:tyrosine-type recombinase/integrase [Corynebacterium glyciniphilum]